MAIRILWSNYRIGWWWNNCFDVIHMYGDLIISPNEVFGDIMVLASPRPRPPRWREHSNSKSIQRISFIKFYMRVDTPWGTLLLNFDTLRGREQLLSQSNGTRIPSFFKMQYLHK